ncbi:anti-sigma factor domain-containing protein [Alicyclobacillus shizuokensis]|uniref:anti-sigma factor domain-containing protein n=1 Tax=Alicyclobacillus shizuokensis TaxID=392014 RepID=UPI000833B42D|nr:anti-sigma factor domain-containing protein [Alicyclobacillus shizuokensis]
MPRGVVLGITRRHAIVLTRDGEFCRIPRRSGMSVGGEVSWEMHRHARNRGWQKAAVAVCTAVVFAGIGLLGAGQFWPSGRAYAYVSLDINPSVSLTVDRHTRVLRASPLNASGRSLLEHVHVDGDALGQAIAQLVTATVTGQMMSSGDTILVSAAPADSSHAVGDMASRAAAAVKSAISGNPSARRLHPRVYSLDLSHSVWKTAAAAKLSPGKLAAYLAAHKEGEPVSLSDLSGDTLARVLTTAQTSKSLLNTLENGDDAAIASLIRSLPASSAPTSAVPSRASESGTAARSGSGGASSSQHGQPQAAGPTDGASPQSGTGQPPAQASGSSYSEDKAGFVRIEVGGVTLWVQVQPSETPPRDDGGAASTLKQGRVKTANQPTNFQTKARTASHTERPASVSGWSPAWGGHARAPMNGHPRQPEHHESHGRIQPGSKSHVRTSGREKGGASVGDPGHRYGNGWLTQSSANHTHSHSSAHTAVESHRKTRDAGKTHGVQTKAHVHLHGAIH